MTRRWRQPVTLGLTLLALLCWALMFAAGTDVWHDTGRLDFCHLSGPPYDDLCAFAYTFYVLLAVLAAQLIVAAADLPALRRTGSGES